MSGRRGNVVEGASRDVEGDAPERGEEPEQEPVAEAGAAASDAPAAADPTAELGELRDKWLRAEAELQNVRRRAAREREELRRELEDQWLLEAASLLDDLDRGLSAAREGGAPENWTRGFELAGQRIRELLDRYGVAVVDPAGQPFDPRLHEALLEVDAPEGVGAGQVAHVVSRGYARQGRSLRAARVAVTRARSEGESPS